VKGGMKGGREGVMKGGREGRMKGGMKGGREGGGYATNMTSWIQKTHELKGLPPNM